MPSIVEEYGERASVRRRHAFNERSADAGAQPLSLKIDLIGKVDE
jgi:hypothetical protein